MQATTARTIVFAGPCRWVTGDPLALNACKGHTLTHVDVREVPSA